MSCTDIPNFDFEVNKGDDVTFPLRYMADGSPVDLTGSTLTFECSEASLNYTMDIPLPKDGRGYIKFIGAETGAILGKNLKYRVYLWTEGLGGPRTTLVDGKLKLKGTYNV